eukprot:4141665-Prymnesium_polylepis.1
MKYDELTFLSQAESPAWRSVLYDPAPKRPSPLQTDLLNVSAALATLTCGRGRSMLNVSHL